MVLIRGCVSHRERTRAESVGWVYMYSASETCICVNQGDIKFGLRPEHLLPGLGLWLDFMHACLVATM